MADESLELLAGDKDGRKVIRQLGTDIEDDSDEAHFVLVLPHDSEANKENLDKLQEKAGEWWEKIFHLDGADMQDLPKPPANLDGMTRRQFHEVVRNALVEILTGSHCCFRVTAYKSCDGHDIILKIKLADTYAMVQIASDEKLRRRLTPEIYAEYNLEVPTEKFSKGSFVKDAKPMPGYILSSKGHHKICGTEFTEVACMRMVRRRMATFIDVGQLIKSGVASQGFYAHTYTSLEKLYQDKWNDWSAILQWPGQQHTDSVREYFGEEYGFFGHWLNFFNRYLVVAGVCGLVAAIVERFVFQDEGDEVSERDFESLGILDWPSGNFGRAYVRLLFTLFMCLWGSVYTKHYQQRSNFKVMEWGMKNYSDSAHVRSDYQKEYRGTWQESAQRTFHWILALVVMCETLVFVYLMSLFRNYCNANPDKDIIFGIKGESAATGLANFLVTANIKIVDQIWKRLSPFLSSMENWRTDQDLKNAMVLKMFIVKFVVYYYPFWFIAFIQESWYGMTSDQCILELQYQIYVYFPTEVIFSILFTILPLLMSWWQVRSKTRANEDARSMPKHTEIQAITPDYTDSERYLDTMEHVLSFGFLMMFTTVLVVMPLIALVSNLIQIRLTAFRLSFANKRITPRGQEGFGVWTQIVQTITFVGVLCNVGLAAFVMKPFRELPLQNRMIWFLLGEHVLLMIKLFITTAVPDIADNQKFIEEYNTATIPIIQYRSVRESHGEDYMQPDTSTITKVDLSHDKWR